MAFPAANRLSPGVRTVEDDLKPHVPDVHRNRHVPLLVRSSSERRHSAKTADPIGASTLDGSSAGKAQSAHAFLIRSVEKLVTSIAVVAKPFSKAGFPSRGEYQLARTRCVLGWRPVATRYLLGQHSGFWT